jgi:hypothetical protein
LSDYERNHAEMIDLATRHGARVILLYDELWTDGPYLKPLGAIARAKGVPLIDASSLMRRERGPRPTWRPGSTWDRQRLGALL